MNIEIVPAALDDKPILQRMMELYQYDFSEFEHNDLDSHGCYGYPYLDLYWSEPGRHPFLIRVDGRLAGFALVNQWARLPKTDWSVAEFFILRKYRRNGVGKAAAFFIFDQFHGRWEVSQFDSNPSSQVFWRRVITEYTGGKFTEVKQEEASFKGTVQTFEN